MTAAMGETTGNMAGPPAEELRISHLKYSETVTFALQLRGRADTEWQRVVNMHAALIAVMIFFANETDGFLAARILVFVFYTYNVAVALVNLREAFAGLRAVSNDLRLFPPPPSGGEGLQWLTRRGFRYDATLQCGLLVVVWGVIGILLLAPGPLQI